MSVKSTYSPAAVLGEIRDSLSAVATTAASQDGRAEDTNEKLDRVVSTLERIKTGQELHVWGNEVNEAREEE